MTRKTKKVRRRYCYKCGMELNPAYGEKMMCLDCSWWAEQASKARPSLPHPGASDPDPRMGENPPTPRKES